MTTQLTNVRPLRRPTAEISSAGRRWRTNWPAELGIGAATQACSVEDISCWGARVRLENPPPPGSSAVLMIDNIGKIPAEVVWSQAQQLGLRFAEPQAWVERLHLRQLEPASWSSER